MILCGEEKANQMQDEKNTSCNGNWLCGMRFVISYLIGHHTIKMSKSDQSVHGFWIRTVTFDKRHKIKFVFKKKLSCVNILTKASGPKANID